MSIPALNDLRVEQQQIVAEQEKANQPFSTLLRITKVALPFISFYAPLTRPLSYTLGAVRTVSTGVAVKGSLFNVTTLTTKLHAGAHFSVALLALLSLIYANPFLNLVVVGGEMLLQSEEIYAAYQAGNYADLGERLLTAACQILYFVLLLSFSLEGMLMLLILQASLQLYLAGHNYKKGKYLEVIASIAMSLIRGFGAHTLYSEIQKRNCFINQPRFSQLKKVLEVQKDKSFLKDHPLKDLLAFIEKKGVKIELTEGESLDLGAHLGLVGKDLVKGMNLTLRSLDTEQGKVVQLLFKINHVHRAELEVYIEALKKLPPDEIAQFLSYMGYEQTAVKVDKVASSFFFGENDNLWGMDSFGEEHRITLETKGEVRIGASEEVVALYDRVLAQLLPGRGLKDLDQMLSISGLGNALRPSSQSEIERMKLGHLWRAYHPSDALNLERTKRFFDMPLSELKSLISSWNPDMKERIEMQLPKMQTTEVIPGRLRFTIPDLADEARKEGALGLFLGITSDGAIAFDRLAKILKSGLISTEQKQAAGIPIDGAGPYFDVLDGSSDSTFQRLVTQNMVNEEIDNISFAGRVQLIVDLKAVETGTYQYHQDLSGTRYTKDHLLPLAKKWGLQGIVDFFYDLASQYEKREDIISFTKMQMQFVSPEDNELMIKDRVTPQMIRCALVQNETDRAYAIAACRAHNLFDAEGKINGIPIDEFFKVRQTLTEDLFNEIVPA